MPEDLLVRTNSEDSSSASDMVADASLSLAEEMGADRKHLAAIRRAVKSLLDNSHLLLNHRKRFAALIGLLRDQLALHFALKESQGYMQTVVDGAPRLSNAVQRLRNEHAELFESIRNIADDSEEVPHRHLTLEELDVLVQRLTEFSQALDQHDENERQLLFEATDRDLGGEG